MCSTFERITDPLVLSRSQLSENGTNERMIVRWLSTNILLKVSGSVKVTIHYVFFKAAFRYGQNGRNAVEARVVICIPSKCHPDIKVWSEIPYQIIRYCPLGWYTR